MKYTCLMLMILAAVLSCVDQTETPVREVPVPVIDSVSQGAFADYIRIEWHADSIDLSRFEIFRSLSESGPFESLSTVSALPTSNKFSDSVKNNSVYYYKITAIDSKGKSSTMSQGGHGFIRSIPTAPVLRIQEYADFVALFWTSSPEAKEYAIYRSSVGCTTGMTFINRTSFMPYFDSATFPGIAYYTVRSLDNKGGEMSVSNCAWGGLSALTAPGGCLLISNGTRPHTVTLAWDSVPGAQAYIIYRSESYCPKADDEFVRTKSRSYTDSIGKAGYVYYAVAALDNAKNVSAMGTCLRGSTSLLPPPENITATYDEIPFLVILSWKSLKGAHHYIIYRSPLSCFSTMSKIDSTTVTLEYRDSVPTSEPCSYVIAGVDSLGVEGLPSSCVQGRVKLLPAPANLSATRGIYAGKVRVSWDAVAGADGYIYFRGSSNVFEKAIPIDTVTSLFDFDPVDTSALYYYWVAARDRLGPGKHGSYVWGKSIDIPVLSLTGYDEKSVTFSWETDTSALKWKYLYRYSANDDEFHCFDSTTGTSFIDKPVNYYANSYCLLIKTSIGDSIFSNIITGSKLIPAPTGLKATGTADGVYLEWNSLPGIGTYHICRSDSASDSTYFYQETSDTFYFDLEATSLRYRYQIEADNDWMIGKRSDPVICGVVPSASAKRRLSSGK